MTDRRVSAAALARLLNGWRSGGPSPAYLRLADWLRLLVLDGRLPLQTRVPAERELAVELGVSRTTVGAAYARLRDTGFLRSRQGAGTWTDLPASGISAAGAVTAPMHSGSLIDLAHAAPTAPAARLHTAAQDAVTQLTRYLGTHGYDPIGLPALRAAIARRYTERGAPTGPDEVLVTAGAQQAFSLLLRALTEPGDRVLIEHPTYPNALEAIRRAGCRPVPVPLGPDGWDAELLASTIRHAAPRLAYLMPDFHNPTGHRLDAAGRAALVALAARSGTPVVVDESHAELALDVPLIEPVAAFGPIISTGSLSKSFWGGLRTGWIRATPSMIRRVATARASFDLASPVLEQLVSAELVPQTVDVVAERAPALLAGRDRLRARLAARLPDWRPNLPSGGLGLWVDLGAPRSSALAIAAERHGVAVAAGPRFGLDGAYERFVRLPYTLDPDVLDSAVDRLAAAWEAVGNVPVGGPQIDGIA